MKNFVQRTRLLPILLFTLGCEGEAPPVARTVSGLSASNGTTYNGISYGGYSLRTTYYSGFYAPTMFLAPTYGAFDPLAGVGPNGTTLSGTDTGGLDLPAAVESGFELIGGRLTGELEDGSSVSLTVEDVTVGGGLLRYQVAVARNTGGTEHREPLCGVDENGAPVPALAVPGVFDLRAGVIGGGRWSSRSGEFSFACRGSSIAKCVRLGYMPEIEEGIVKSAAYLESCVRMLRADYCGDGTSWTTNGRMIDVWDRRDINVQTREDWPLEAAWGPSGAVCLTDARHLFPEDSPVPFCAWRLRMSSCGWETGLGLLFNSFPREQLEPVEFEAESETRERTSWWSGGSGWSSWSDRSGTSESTNDADNDDDDDDDDDDDE